MTLPLRHIPLTDCLPHVLLKSFGFCAREGVSFNTSDANLPETYQGHKTNNSANIFSELDSPPQPNIHLPPRRLNSAGPSRGFAVHSLSCYPLYFQNSEVPFSTSYKPPADLFANTELEASFCTALSAGTSLSPSSNGSFSETENNGTPEFLANYFLQGVTISEKKKKRKRNKK